MKPSLCHFAGWGIIQGDGIDIHMLAKIMDAVLASGYSAEVRPPSPMPYAQSQGLQCGGVPAIPQHCSASSPT